MDPATAGERRRGVSTDKCPKCGKPLIWCENCFPVFAYCSDTEYCCYETQTKHMEPELVLHPALHRIRELEMSEQILRGGAEHLKRRVQELEAENGWMREALSRIDGYTGEAWTEELAREALKK